MDLGLFLPKIYHFVRQDYVINGKHFNQFISVYNTNNHKDTLALIIGLIVFILGIVLIIGCVTYLNNSGRTSKIESKENCQVALSFFILIAVLGAFWMIFGFLGGIIQPNENLFQSNVADYVLEGKNSSMSTSSKNYTVYARIYNNSSHNYYNYLIGNMVNGYFKTITTTQKKELPVW